MSNISWKAGKDVIESDLTKHSAGTGDGESGVGSGWSTCICFSAGADVGVDGGSDFLFLCDLDLGVELTEGYIAATGSLHPSRKC